jgi:DHA2 family multidrug resistance protein
VSTAAARGAPPCADVPHRRLITLSIMLATIMQVLDTTIANVALPSMIGDLGASTDTINWVLTSYIVAAAIMTPVTGWLSDRIGKRELFLTSILGFVASSVACGLAWSLPSMVMFRVMQGIFGAAVVPLSQTFLLDINPREKAGQAMAMWGAGIMVGPIIGPTLGGWLTESYNWRWVFLINLPLGILAFLGSAAYLPKSTINRRFFDAFGFIALSLGIGALQMMLDRGGEVDWFNALESWIWLFASICGFWIFTVHILTTTRPFLDPRMFTDRNFVLGLVFIFIIGIILLASLALLPPMLSKIFGHTALLSGLVMAPRGIGTMASMLVVGRLVRIVDPRLLVSTGLGLVALSLWIMTGFTPQMDDHLVIWSGVLQGMGLGLVFVPLSTVTFATISSQYRADATALYSLVRNIGSSIGISVVTLMLTRNVQINHMEITGGLTATNPVLQQLQPGAVAGQAQSLQVLDNMVNLQATMIGYVNDFKLMLIMTLCAIPLALTLRRPDAGAEAVSIHAD